MQMLTEEIFSPLSVKQDRRIAGVTPLTEAGFSTLKKSMAANPTNGSWWMVQILSAKNVLSNTLQIPLTGVSGSFRSFLHKQNLACFRKIPPTAVGGSPHLAAGLERI